MKQHLLGSQLKEIDYEERIILLSLVTGLTKNYVRDEYRKGSKDEEGMLMKYGFDIKIGDLIEIIQDFTGVFPAPEINAGKYIIKINGTDFKGNVITADSGEKPTYCDALYDIVKQLLIGKYISAE